MFFSLSITISCQEKVDLSHLDKDRLIVAINTEPKRINPLLLNDSISYAVSSLIYRGLTKIGEDRNILPDLAESWNISKDGREIIFYLRKDVKWHDNTPFTSKDVIATIEKIKDKTSISPSIESFNSIKSIKALDEHTLAIVYREPYSSALESWTIGIMAWHILKDLDFSKSDKEVQHIGTGAYKLKMWQSGQAIYLEANEHFYMHNKSIKNLILKIIPDESAQMMELKRGKVDIMELSVQQLMNESQRDEFKKNFKIYSIPSYSWVFMGFNLKDKRFQDEKVRQAISHAIDKSSIINHVLKGNATTLTGPYPPDAWYYNKKAPFFDYNKEKALKLLSESGWQSNSSGLLMKNGNLFEIELSINSENKDNLKTAQIIQQNLKDIGINLSIKTYEWQTFRHKIIEERRFEAILLSRVYLNDPDIYRLWHSREATEGRWNILSYNDKDLDNLLEIARTTIEIDKRRDIYHKIHYRLAEKQPCIFLYNRMVNYAVRNNITDVRLSPNGIFDEIYMWKK